MKFKFYSLLFIILNFSGVIMAQNIEFTNDILKNYLLSSSAENEVAKDINGNPMAIDANGDGEISLEEALKVYQLKVGMGNIFPKIIPGSPELSPPSNAESSDLTYFTNVRILKYRGVYARECYKCHKQFIDATGFTNLEELYYLDGHHLYKVYDIYIKLPDYLPNLKLVDAPVKISYSQAPNLEDLNCTYSLKLGSGFNGILVNFKKLNFSDFKKLKRITANADTIILKNLPILDSVSLVSSFSHLENLPSLKKLKLPLDLPVISDKINITIKNLSNLTSLDLGIRATPSESFNGVSLEQLTLENLPKLSYLNCFGLSIPDFKVSHLPSLTFLNNEYNGRLSILDLSKNVNLKELYLMGFGYSLKDLDLTHNPLLTHLRLGHMYEMTSLDLSKNTNLTNIRFNMMELDKLDFSASTKITSLSEYYSTFKTLIIKNGVTDPWLDTFSPVRHATFNSICCDEIELEKVKQLFSSYTKNITTDCSTLGLSTNEIKTQTEVTLYPNPATDFLYINTKEKITKVEIFDTNGRLLISENITSPKVTVSILPKGSYFMTLHYAKGKINKPFIKN
ncbi:T9SS type A sorting domain-containing protein [Apibacter raozihei]|uniref:T9SS type A sorting domain-containing protein n=1 Tax=Apibacter raozihei TaxID=2500547 RepID=UPI000FE39428|nr:T9SS type A sorting domain-containing protein [Apibacter raozihei]